MTLASDADLRALLADGGQLTISPSHTPEEADALIQSASIDVRLSPVFRVFHQERYRHIDPSVEQPGLTEEITVPQGAPFVLHPGQFVLGSTFEWVRLERNIGGRVDGKSSLARLGVPVEVAGFVDPGFGGHITLEITNLAPLPILLWPGMAIAQLVIMPLHSAAQRPYGVKGRGSHYQGQTGPTESRAHQNFRIWDVYRDGTAPAVPHVGTAAVTA